MATSETEITLGELPIGSRLLVRSKKDWRTAVISKIVEGTVTIIVSSPSGFSYRLRRNQLTKIDCTGLIPRVGNPDETWQTNLGRYDLRW